MTLASSERRIARETAAAAARLMALRSQCPSSLSTQGRGDVAALPSDGQWLVAALRRGLGGVKVA